MAKCIKKLKEDIAYPTTSPTVIIEYCDGKAWFTLATVPQVTQIVNQHVTHALQEVHKRLLSLEKKLK